MMSDKQLKKIEKVKEKLLVSKANLGKAGEYLVAGKLLLSGFNVYTGALDNGIDLVARKSKRFYYIQVKTCQDIDYESGKYIAKVNLSTLLKFPEKRTFLILVLHYLGFNTSLDYMGEHARYDQEFIVLPVEKLVEFFSKTKGNIIFNIYNSTFMNLPPEKQDKWIFKLRYQGKDFVLDDFLFDSFWQIEI